MTKISTAIFLVMMVCFSSYAEPVPFDKAINLVTQRLEKLERFVFLYSMSYPDSADGENPAYKKLILMGRDQLNLTEKADNTLRVQEELYWFQNSTFPEFAPIHSLGFSDGKTSYYWLSQNNSSNKSSPGNYMHTQIPPSIYGFVESWLISPLQYSLNNEHVKKIINKDNFSADITESVVTIQLLKSEVFPIESTIVFHIKKGLQQMKSSLGDFIVDEHQQVKEGLWVPRLGRLTHQDKPNVNMEVLKVKVNDDIDPALFKNFPWNDPKYNTKFGMRWEGDIARRTHRIQYNDHPPSYYTSFFDMTLEEAYQTYLVIK